MTSPNKEGSDFVDGSLIERKYRLVTFAEWCRAPDLCGQVIFGRREKKTTTVFYRCHGFTNLFVYHPPVCPFFVQS